MYFRERETGTMCTDQLTYPSYYVHLEGQNHVNWLEIRSKRIKYIKYIIINTTYSTNNFRGQYRQMCSRFTWVLDQNLHGYHGCINTGCNLYIPLLDELSLRVW